VRGLRTTEAVRRTEKALADAYERGEAALVLMVGASPQGVAAVKPAVTKALRECVAHAAGVT
jgi:hypothetical protein